MTRLLVFVPQMKLPGRQTCPMMRYSTILITTLLAASGCSPRIEVQPTAPQVPTSTPMQSEGGCEAMRKWFPIPFYYISGLPKVALDDAKHVIQANAAFKAACP